MRDDLDSVPPAIPLLVIEVLGKSNSPKDAYDRLKNLWPEIQSQSRFHMENFSLAAPKNRRPDELNIYLDGGLNLFDARVGCADIDCRLEAARHLARSLALVGDTLWITDYLTEQFLEHGKVDDEKLYRILTDTLVLSELFPLIAAGIIKFRSPWRSVCESCNNAFDTQVEEMVEDSLKEYSSEFDIEKMCGGGYALHTGGTYHPSMVLRVYPTKWLGAQRTPTAEEAKRNVAHTAIRSALWTCDEASKGNGVLFSNSAIGMAAFVKREQKLEGRSSLRAFDERRSVQIPWVTELNASQIVELRSEASKALPALRELLARHLTVAKTEDKNPGALIDELRWQAVETRNELENVQGHAGRYWKAAYATVGLSISAYGLGTDGVIPSLGGLLPILHLLIEHKGGSKKEVDRLQRRPGYVLVKAQDILKHAHS